MQAILEERTLTEISVLQMKEARQKAVEQTCCICLSDGCNMSLLCCGCGFDPLSKSCHSRPYMMFDVLLRKKRHCTRLCSASHLMPRSSFIAGRSHTSTAWQAGSSWVRRPPACSVASHSRPHRNGLTGKFKTRSPDTSLQRSMLPLHLCRLLDCAVFFGHLPLQLISAITYAHAEIVPHLTAHSTTVGDVACCSHLPVACF